MKKYHLFIQYVVKRKIVEWYIGDVWAEDQIKAIPTIKAIIVSESTSQET